MKTLFLFLFACVFLWFGEAQAQTCTQWNTPGCIQLRILSVDAAATKRYTDAVIASSPKGSKELFRAEEAQSDVDGLVGGTFTSATVAAGMYNLSHDPNAQSVLRFTSSCTPHYVYAWGVRKEASEGIREWNAATPQSATVPQRLAVAAEAPPAIPPDEVFLINVCGGEGAINLPWSYLTDNTYVLVCPLGASLYPNRRNGGQEGHHLKPAEWRRLRQENRNFAVLVTVMPGSLAAAGS